MPFNLPVVQSTGHCRGAAAGSPVVLSGIKTGDVILALVRWKQGEQAAPVAPASFVVSDGAIQSASVSTEGYMLACTWTH